MSQLTPEIPLMASLWIRSGYDMKVGKSAETYQVGAYFKALIKAILVARLKSFERFFRISSSPAGLCKKPMFRGCYFLPFCRQKWIKNPLLSRFAISGKK